jgi:hypothetical protein
LKNSLFLFCFLSLLGQFIFIPAVIHNLADRGNSAGRNFNQVKTKIISNSNRFVCRNNAKLIAVGIYYSDFFCSYVSINIYSVSVWPFCTFRNSYAFTS